LCIEFEKNLLASHHPIIQVPYTKSCFSSSTTFVQKSLFQRFVTILQNGEGNKLQAFLSELNIPFQFNTPFAQLVEGILVYLAVEIKQLKQRSACYCISQKKGKEKKENYGAES